VREVADESAPYTVRLGWSDEDYSFVANVPELPGCMADGASYEEALANIKIVIDEWIAVANELGRTIPKPKNNLSEARERLL
jgi:predicted RNase H-like HicB family nuclease